MKFLIKHASGFSTGVIREINTLEELLALREEGDCPIIIFDYGDPVEVYWYDGYMES